jgi:integrase
LLRIRAESKTMGRTSKGPWLWKGRGYWVQHGGRKLYLADDEREAIRRWHKVQSGEPLEDPATTGSPRFHEVMEAYCEEIERTRSAEHLRGTAWRLNQLCAHLRNRAVVSLSLQDVQGAMQPYGWGPTTQANVLTSLRGMLRWASRPGGMIPTNPLPILTLPRANTRIHTMDADQVKALLDAAAEPLRSILWALSVSGARPSELIRAKATDCDPDGAAVRLAKGKQGRRIIYFPPSARERLAAIRKAASGSLFSQPNGTPWSSYYFFRLTREARERAQLPKWATAYCLRHGWVTERLREGVPIATVARMAGTSVTMVDKCYGHLADQDLRLASDGMG